MVESERDSDTRFYMADAMQKVEALIRYKGSSLGISDFDSLIKKGRIPPGSNLHRNLDSQFIDEGGLKGILKQDGKKNKALKKDGHTPTFPKDRFEQLCLAFQLTDHEKRLFRESSGDVFVAYLKTTYSTAESLPLTVGETEISSCENHRSAHEARAGAESDETLVILQALIADMLAARGEAVQWLAPRLGVRAETVGERREGIAKVLVQAEVKTLFDLWLSALNGEDGLERADARFVEAVIHAALPATYPYLNDPQSIRAGQAEGFPCIALVACHQTLAEIAVAAADRRRALFKRPDDTRNSRNAYPGGEGQLARVFGSGPEVGRNAEGRQTREDFASELADSVECCFDDVAERLPHFLRREYGAGYPGAAEETGPLTEKVVDWIRAGLEGMAEDRAYELDSKRRSGYTFYAVVETPPGLAPDVRAHQDRILQELKTLFPQIAFLRLAPLHDHFSDQMIPYYKLRDRLRRSAQDQNP